MVATWKTGLYAHADAQKVADELLTLGKEFKPSDVVEMAKNPKTESHKCFEWDDQKAADKYRLSQARILVCNLVYTEPETKENTEPIRVFFKPDKECGYKPTKMILRNPDEYQSLLKQCAIDLERIKTKYHSLTEYDWLWEKIG